MTLRALVLALVAVLVLLNPAAAGAAAEGLLTWAVHISLAPTWFDPAETPGMITPYLVLYALHDALIKPLPGQPKAPGLAESWSVSKDGLVYEFVLRKGALFHNGEPVTADDVKFSLDRYRGAAAKPLKERVASVETPDPLRVRIRLKQPWPDSLTFYTNATGAGWIVPRKYVDKVGEEGFKKAPVGAGPYKFVSFTPGVELVLEAFESYWRKSPSVKRLVFRVIPDEATRLAALKRGEVDIAYSIRGELAEELQKTPGLTLKPAVIQSPFWLYFPEQWNPKSPWHDRRVRLAASLAIDRPSINQALTLGHSRLSGSIIPTSFEYFWQPTCPTPTWARRWPIPCRLVGIRVKLRPLERAAFFSGYAEKKFKNIIQASSGAFGNAATHEKVVYAPIWELAFLNGVGPRVRESGLGLIAGHAYSAPYEDVSLKGK